MWYRVSEARAVPAGTGELSGAVKYLFGVLRKPSIHAVGLPRVDARLLSAQIIHP